MEIAGFDWDDDNWPKCGKHGASRTEIEQVLLAARIAPDLKHSQQEPRFIAVGRSHAGRPMFVAFAIRQRLDGRRLVRPISARYMHAKEVQRYEESFESSGVQDGQGGG